MAEVAINVPPELPATMKKFIETVKKLIPDQAIDINGLFATGRPPVLRLARNHFRFVRVLSASGTLQKNVFRRAMESDHGRAPTAPVGALSF
jgi:hypothetical protein